MGTSLWRVAFVVLLMASAPRGLWAFSPVRPSLNLVPSSNGRFEIVEIDRYVCGVIDKNTNELIWLFKDDHLHGTYFVNDRGDTVTRVTFGNLAYLFASKVPAENYTLEFDVDKKMDKAYGPYCLQVFRSDQCIREYTVDELCWRIVNNSHWLDEDHGNYSQKWLDKVSVNNNRLEMITADDQQIVFDMDTGEIISREYISTPSALKPFRFWIALGLGVLLIWLVVVIARRY